MQLVEAHSGSCLEDGPSQATLKCKVLTAALHALSSLALDHGPITACLTASPSWLACLGHLLDQRASPYDCTLDDACVVLACHTLLHVLGHMLSNGKARGQAGSRPSSPVPGSPGTTQSSPATSLLKTAHSSNAASKQLPLATVGSYGAATGTAVVGPDSDVVDGRAVLVVGPQAECGSPGSAGCGQGQQGQVVYISLAAAAKAVGVMLPALPQLAVGRKDGGSVLEPVEAVELRCKLGDVLAATATMLFRVCC
ncbi:hypothetical protein V8C86DRAFT_742874 [Haematococcus lacustris]